MTDQRIDAAREARARRGLRTQGLEFRKSRLRGPIHLDNHGGYMIVDGYLNAINAGPRFDLDLDEVEEWATPVVAETAAAD